MSINGQHFYQVISIDRFTYFLTYHTRVLESVRLVKSTLSGVSFSVYEFPFHIEHYPITFTYYIL